MIAALYYMYIQGLLKKVKKFINNDIDYHYNIHFKRKMDKKVIISI